MSANIDEDDILSDARNLFIQEDAEKEELEEVKKTDRNMILTEKSQDNVAVGRVIFDGKKDIEVVGSPSGTNPKEQPENQPENQPKNQPVPAHPSPKQQKQRQTPAICKSSADCDKSSYCLLKSGKCQAKLQQGQSGCTSTDACLNAACYEKKCFRTCGGDSDCVAGEGCAGVKGDILVVFAGLEGAESLKGVCKAGKTKISHVSDVSESGAKEKSSSSVAIISAISLSSVLLAFLVFFYLRRRSKRRRTDDTNPEMFLFNKLQRSTSTQSGLIRGPNVPDGSSTEQLNSRLAEVSGARFTRWSVSNGDES